MRRGTGIVLRGAPGLKACAVLPYGGGNVVVAIVWWGNGVVRVRDKIRAGCYIIIIIITTDLLLEHRDVANKTP